MFFSYFSDKIRLGISCELTAYQMIHMKCQALFSLKTKKKNKKKIEVSYAAVVISTVRIDVCLIAELLYMYCMTSIDCLVESQTAVSVMSTELLSVSADCKNLSQ